jgi:hypothetical protein
MEGLSLMLKQAQAEGKITGIKTSRLIKLIVLLFVDDVLIMTRAQISDWKEIDYILSLFCKASGLVINPHKSSFHYSGLQEHDLDNYKAIFPSILWS